MIRRRGRFIGGGSKRTSYSIKPNYNWSSGVNPQNKKSSGNKWLKSTVEDEYDKLLKSTIDDYYDTTWFDSTSRKPVGMAPAPKNLQKSAVAFEVTRYSGESYGVGNYTITSEKTLLNDGNGMYAAPGKFIALFMILYIYNMITC